MSSPIVSFDEQAVKDELRELVRKTAEETINAMLDEEAIIEMDMARRHG